MLNWLAGILLTFLYRTLLPDLALWVKTQVEKLIALFRQKKAKGDLEEDVREQKPRSDEVRKDEDNYINS